MVRSYQIICVCDPASLWAPSQSWALRSKVSLSKGVPFLLTHNLCFSPTSCFSQSTALICLQNNTIPKDGPLWFSGLGLRQSHPQGLLKHWTLGFNSRNPDSVCWGWNLIICIYYDLSCADDATSQATLSEPLDTYSAQKTVSSHLGQVKRSSLK